MSKHVNYSNEINTSVNSKVYFKAESHISTIDLTKYYKIKQAYLNPDYKNELMRVFTYEVEPPLLAKLIVNYVNENYYQPDLYIYREIVNIILAVKPDLKENIYINRIKEFVE